jgi:hypothetical protein
MANIGEDIMRAGVFIRYNPDTFKVDGRSMNPRWSARMDMLGKWLRHVRDFSNVPHTLQMVRLFFDEYKVDNCSMQILRAAEV